MQYQILLSPDLDLRPADFVALWSEESKKADGTHLLVVDIDEEHTTD